MDKDLRKICDRDEDCPKYNMGDKVVIIDKRHSPKVRTFISACSWSNNHFMLMHEEGMTKILHPFSWLQFRAATDEEKESGVRNDEN